MARIHPIWPTWAVLGGLALVFFGERVFGAAPIARGVLDGLGALLLVAAAAARALDWSRAENPRKWVARTLALATFGVLLALAGYALLSLALDDGPDRARSLVWGAWPVLLMVALFTLLALELAVAPVARNPDYETARVRGSVGRGLGLALLLGVLAFGNLLADRHDVKWELSAGSRAVPSPETERAVRELTKEVRVVLFWPRANEVGDVVERYFAPLAALGPNLSVERRDHALASKLAAELGVTENGWVALTHDGAKEKVRVGVKPRSARSNLRRLDRDVLRALLTVTMRKRVAYFTAGHGERALRRPAEDDVRSPITLLRQQLEAWQFEIEELGVAQGSTERIPDEASIVLAIGPTEPFLPAEEEALRQGLERGARLLVALDPTQETAPLGDLLADLGLRFDPAPVAHLQKVAPLTRTKADRALIYSNRYASHPSTSVVGRDARLATVFAEAASLELAEGGPSVEGAKLDVVVRALDGSFRDLDRDLDRDPDEPSGDFPLAAALTRTSTRGPEAEARAFVIADADVFSDRLLRTVQGNLLLFADVVSWLQIDQQPIVPTVSEKDVRIVHKGEDDALLFYGTTFGASLLVLGAGFFATRRRRRR